jgi:hypothetical protein
MAAPRHTKRDSGQTREGMHVCPQCRSELVQPLEWFERDSDSWAVELRCPECEWRGGGVYNQDQVDRFDRHLDDGCTVVHADLKLLTRDNMEHEADTFAAALHSGAILPEDF